MRSLPAVVPLVLAAGFLGACGPSGAPEPARNLLVICVDTLRADLLGTYGGPQGLTPRLDGLASESAVFERAHSAASWTLPSVAATFTSQVPSTTGLWTFESRLGEGFETLAERFRAAGFATHGIASHVFFQERYGLVQGFETFDAELAHRKGEPGWREVTSPIVARKASEWLAQHASGDDARPWMLFLHFFDPHLPYVDHEAGPGRAPAQNELARYRSEISYTDGHVGQVLDALAASGHAQDTAVLFFSDHGEAFGEHPPIQRHSYGLYDEELRVPLLLRAPGIAPRRVVTPVRSVDVLPTLLELFGLPDPQAELRAGRSLLALARGHADDGPRPTLAEIRLKEGFHANALVAGDHKLVERVSQGRFELYDLARDPLERHDLAASEPERVAALRAELSAAIERAAALGERFGPGAAVEHTPAELENLKELGYGGE